MCLGLSKQNAIFKLKEITPLNMQNKLQHVRRLATGISSLWKQERCYLNQGVEGLELLKKTSSVLFIHLIGVQESQSQMHRSCIHKLLMPVANRLKFWSLFCIFSCGISCRMNIRFCFDKPRRTFCFFLRCKYFYKG